MSDDRATLDSVARHARVSRQTVSNVLNAPERVKPETRDRVKAAIDTLDYRPHLAARQLRTKRSRLIGLRIEPVRDGINGVVLDRFLHALTSAAEQAGYRVMLFTADDDTAEIAAYEELVGGLDLDAFVLTSTHHGDARTAHLREQGTPFVTFGRPWGAEDAHSWVDVDGSAGTAEAVEHLADKGHTAIAYVGWPAGSGTGDDRRAGFHAALARRGLTAEADLTMDDGVDQARAAVSTLLDRPRPPTAFVCASDSLALGVLSAAAQAGTEVGVVGFDDTPVAGALGLSSVSQPIGEVAHACVDQLRRLLTRTDAPPEHVLLPSRLEARGSSA